MRHFNIVAPSELGMLITNRNDRVIGRQLAQTGSWEKNYIRLIGQILGSLHTKKPISIIDAGANIGVYTLAFARLPFVSTIHAIEAQRLVFQQLNGNIALNSLINVHTHHAAVTSESGSKMTFASPDPRHAANFGAFELGLARNSDFDGTRFLEAEHIPTLAIDDLNLTDCGFIKLDVEGMEDKALAGARRTIAASKPLIFFERHKTDFAAVTRLLEEHGYKLAVLRGYDVIAHHRDWKLDIKNNQNQDPIIQTKTKPL